MTVRTRVTINWQGHRAPLTRSARGWTLPATRELRFLEPLEARSLFNGVNWNPMLDPAVLADIQAGEEVPDDGTPVPTGTAFGPSSPSTSGTIEAINFDNDIADNNGGAHVPPDTTGAAGPTNVVDAVNTSIEWFSKAGTLQNRQRLGLSGGTASGSFFAPLNPVNSLFDPRVVYDTYNDRFVVVADEQTDTAKGDTSNTSRVLIAVSDDSDPNGTWFYTQVNSTLNVSGTPTWADFPQIGLDGSNLYLTANQFGFSGGSGVGSRLWIVPKSGFYSGTPATFPSYAATDPGAAAGVGSLGSETPTVMFGATPGSVGTYLVSSGLTSGSTDYLSVIAVNPSALTFTNTYVNLGDISNGTSFPAAPQLGDTHTIDTNDIRIQNAVWRNGNLYATNTINAVSGADAGTATAHYYRMSTASPTAPSLAEQANIGGEDIAAGTRTFFPSIAVDANNDIAVNFSYSGPNTYAGMAYAVRKQGTDANGVSQPATVYAAGVAPYVRTFSSGGTGDNRWGDYTMISADPSDGSRFWVYGLYAIAQGTVFLNENGRWGTRWANFTLSTAVPPPTPDTPDLVSTSDSGVSDSDNVTNATAPTFQGVTVANATVSLYVDGGSTAVATIAADASGNYTITDNTPLADGTHTFTVTATADALTSATSPALSVTIDTVAPDVLAASFVRSPVQTIVIAYSEPIAVGTSSVLATNQDDATVYPATGTVLSNTTSASYDIANDALTDGEYLVTLVGPADVAGNVRSSDAPILSFGFLAADFDGNNRVDFADLLILAKHYNQSGQTNATGDANYDGTVDFTDLLRLAKSYGKTVTPPVFATSAALTAIDPTSVPARKRPATASGIVA